MDTIKPIMAMLGDSTLKIMKVKVLVPASFVASSLHLLKEIKQKSQSKQLTTENES
jgi:hypothetical protein